MAGDTERTEIVTFTGGFHGRTMGALALTPRDAYQLPYRPMMPGVVVATFNDLDSARDAIGAKTAAVFVEPIQGEGGINPADPEFLQGLRTLCDEAGALLVFDEIQCGVGRTGTLWAYEQYGVVPDIMTLAKPLAGGLPMGAVLMTEAVAAALRPGDHGSTFAAGLMVSAAAKVVLERVSQPEFLTHVEEMGEYLMERLEEINSPLITGVRGRGLIAGIELSVEAAPLVKAGFDQGLLLINAGPNVIRFVPPLVVEKADIDTMIEKLTTILGDAVNA
jgi:acetylornithine/succinyldiaminopimelate/putrescine aminotransferase